MTDLYASLFLTARAGSVHGYDMVDPLVINPEIGTEDDLGTAARCACGPRGMGLVMDIVPNHICVATNDKVRWTTCSRTGRARRSHGTSILIGAPKAELRDKVLGGQYGKVLEARELQLVDENGALFTSYYDKRFPIGPGTYPLVLEDTGANAGRGAQ